MVNHSILDPLRDKIYKVIDLVKKLEILKNFKQKHLIKKNKSFKETKILKLNSYKSKKILNWETKLNLKGCPNIFQTFYKNYFNRKYV